MDDLLKALDVTVGATSCLLGGGAAVEPTAFRRDAMRHLQACGGERAALKVVQGFKTAVGSDDNKLRAVLAPLSTTQQQAQAHCNSNMGETLTKLLLRVDLLQPELIAFLLEKLCEYGINDSASDSSDSFPRLLLNQLRWLNHVVKPAELASRLMEIIPISPLGLQKEIILAIPEIVGDAEHKIVVCSFVETLSTTVELFVPIMDTLSNLNLDEKLLMQVREVVLDRLPSVDLADLPVVIRFLLQSATTATVSQV